MSSIEAADPVTQRTKKSPKPQRYDQVSVEKAEGATYTPPELAQFVAARILDGWHPIEGQGPIRILDPAVGEGELLVALLEKVPLDWPVEVFGFDKDQTALELARSRLLECRPGIKPRLEHGDFLEAFCGDASSFAPGTLFGNAPQTYDLVIANPPYVRTQILGAVVAQALAQQFGLRGRVDLYHAFALAIAGSLEPKGRAGIIMSNRFMTTKGGATVRKGLCEGLRLRHIWDFGDTKLFDAAVLPAVLLADGNEGVGCDPIGFTSIYETKRKNIEAAETITKAVDHEGVVCVPDGRNFFVQQGVLDTSGSLEGVWRISTEQTISWLDTVHSHTWRTFRDIGKVRVGIKTCADSVFIRKDWNDQPQDSHPELLRGLTTHHIGRQFRADKNGEDRRVIYPHAVCDGKRSALDLSDYPKTRKYLEQHRERLEGRSYLIDAGRKWYELWVPQDPTAWELPKLVFRDISEHPCFWLDLDGTIVNGDCYWMVCDDQQDEDLLWLAVAIGNSSFSGVFYDRQFNNKLYSGRRRYISQYVEKFPIPDPGLAESKEIIALAKGLYHSIDDSEVQEKFAILDQLVWSAFGLVVEESHR